MTNQPSLVRFARIFFTRYFALLALFAVLAGNSAARAHELRPSVIDLTINTATSITARIEMNAEALLAGIGTEHDDTDNSPQAALYDSLRVLDANALSQRMEDFAPEWIARQALGWRYDAFSTEAVGDIALARKSVVTLTLAIEEGTDILQLAFPPLPNAIALRIRKPGQEQPESFWIKQGDAIPAISLASAGSSAGFADTVIRYLELGFIHILPEGMDHILFVLGLFLLSLRLKPLLWQVSAFTAAHTLTLGLSIYGVINLPPAIVEPLIALSIAVVAIENLIRTDISKARLWIVTGFGLLHGLGFAGVLRELGLPQDQYLTALISFNIGVEIGQLTVILLAFLAVGMWGRGKDWYRPFVIIPGSLLIAFTGLWWCIERVFLGG